MPGQKGFGFNDHERTLRMIEDVFEFLGGGFASPGDADSAEGHQGQVGDDPGVAVVREQHDLAAAADLAFFEGPGQQDDIFAQLFVVDLEFLVADPVDKRSAPMKPVAGCHNGSDHRR